MKREFVITRHGRDYVLYAGLLDAAHQQGLKAIRTLLVQTPTPQNGNVAICTAEIITEKGTFTGIGDADPANVNRVMVNALIRMAETRAKARALRDAVNVSMVAIEELAESAPDSLLLDDLAPPAAPPAAAPSLAPVVPLAGIVPPAHGAQGAHATGHGPVTGRASGSPAGPAEIVSLDAVRQHAVAESGQATSSAAGGSAGAAAVAERGGGGMAEAPARTAPRLYRGGSAASGAGTKALDGPPLPATQTQLETIAKLARSAGRTVSTEGLTRASASELITRLSEERYGARRGG